MTAESFFPTFQERRWFQMGDILFLNNARFDPPSSRLETEYTFIRGGRTDMRPASIRVHGYRELCRLLEEAGFGGCAGYSSLSQEPFRLGSPRLLLVATRV